MLFSGIGSIRNTIKLQALTMKWEKRKDNPNLPKKEEEDPKIANLKRQAEDIRKGNIISSLDCKLKSGSELTKDELEYLKINNPSLYAEAIEVKKEREKYKKQIAACKTKEDVEKVRANKLQEFSAQAKTISANPSIPEGQKKVLLEKLLKKIMGIQNEHSKFTNTSQYQELPQEEELDKSKDKKKKPKPFIEEEAQDSEKNTLDVLYADLSDSLKNITDYECQLPPSAGHGRTYNALGSMESSTLSQAFDAQVDTKA